MLTPCSGSVRPASPVMIPLTAVMIPRPMMNARELATTAARVPTTITFRLVLFEASRHGLRDLAHLEDPYAVFLIGQPEGQVLAILFADYPKGLPGAGLWRAVAPGWARM